jgi:hypothetical protein
MKTSVVIIGRNDNYGGTLNERASFCINTMLDAFDEVVFVDWDTKDGKPPLTDVLDIQIHPERLVTIIVRPDEVEKIMGYAPTNFCEVIPRNIGIRRATGDVIVLAALDIIGPRRSELVDVAARLEPGEMITTKRSSVDISVVKSVFEQTKSYTFTRDYMFEHYGVASINVARMFPVLTVTKEIMMQLPENARYNAASIIGGCGDFQMAHRDTWWRVRGFEEDQVKRNFMDTEVQYKVIMSGGKVTASNFPPVYHIDHPRLFDDEKYYNKREFYETRNTENWGFPSENFEIKRCTSNTV